MQRFFLLACGLLLLTGCATQQQTQREPDGKPVAKSESSAAPPSAPIASAVAGDRAESAASPSSPLAKQPPALASTESKVPAAEAESAMSTGWSQHGIASWYGPRFQGRLTANGERFDTNQLTAAHKSLPFGTQVRVTSLVNGKQTIVRINDRGPFIAGRIIDLSRAAAQAIGLSGIKQVKIERLK